MKPLRKILGAHLANATPRICGPGNAVQMLLDAAARHPERPAVIENAGRRTTGFRELVAHALGIAALLKASGLSADERVGILLERGADSAAAYFGILAAGGVAVNINEGLRPRQIDYILAHSGARYLVSSGTLLDKLPRGLNSEARIVDLDVAAVPESIGEIARRTASDMAHLIYTSGSTGMPKGVVVSHGNVWAGMSAVVEYVGITCADRIASLLPFSFDYGLNQLHCAMATGASLIVETTPVPQRIVQSLEAHEVSVLPAVPPLWLQILNVQRFRKAPLPAIRAMTNTGGKIPTEAVRRLRAAQPQADLFLMYGLTEAFRSTYLPPDLVDRKPDSIGRAIPGAEIIVVDECMNRCGPNEIGQLVHRGPTVTLGYWTDHETTGKRFGPNPLRPEGTPDAERVVFSGDLVRMDEDGDLFFVGRHDGMLKSLGHRVAPDEITDVLYASGEIVEAAIVGEPDEMRGDAIVAHVVLAKTGDLKRLKAHAARELPRYMQPVRYEVHDALARTASGKHDAKAMASAGGA